MSRDTSKAAELSAPKAAFSVERFLFRDVGGVPVAVLLCGVAAVVFGGLIAVTAGH